MTDEKIVLTEEEKSLVMPEEKDLEIEHHPEYKIYDCRFYRDNFLDISVLVIEPDNPSGRHRHIKSYEWLRPIENLALTEQIIEPNEGHNLVNTSNSCALVLSQMIPDLNFEDLVIEDEKKME